MLVGALAWLWGKAGGALLRWGSILLTVLGVLLYLRHLIIAGERGQQASKALEASNERKNLDRQVDALPDSDVRKLLRAQRARFKRQLQK